MDPLERARYHLLITQVLFGACYAVLIYDWLVCLPRELRLIWPIKFSIIKAMYFFCRYWPVVSFPYILYAYTFPHDEPTCRRIFRIPVALATWNQLAAEGVLLARTVAFLGKSTVILVGLSICLCAVVAYQTWVVFWPMVLLPFIPPATTGPCLPTSPGQEILGFFLSSTCFDALVTAFMVWRVLQLKNTESGGLSRSPLVQLFVSEGKPRLWYFVFMSVANIVNGIFYAQPVKTLSAIMVPFSIGLPCALACRLILDLREHGSDNDCTWVTTGHTRAGFFVPRPLFKPRKDSRHVVSTIQFRRSRPTGPSLMTDFSPPINSSVPSSEEHDNDIRSKSRFANEGEIELGIMPSEHHGGREVSLVITEEGIGTTTVPKQDACLSTVPKASGAVRTDLNREDKRTDGAGSRQYGQRAEIHGSRSGSGRRTSPCDVG